MHHPASLPRPSASWPTALRLRGIACIASCVMLASTAMPSLAAEKPAPPALKIEVGMHTSQINRVATDASGRWAATASLDNTVRVWDTATGKTVQVLRPSRLDGTGGEARLYAVALSPDGEVVAAAGLAADNAVYLFHRATGKLLKRLLGAPSVVFHLAFSPDGTWLAAGLAAGPEDGPVGVRVWRWQQPAAPAWSDAGYGGPVYSLQFAPKGAAGTTLATASGDGHVRLYRWAAEPGGSGKLALSQKQRMASGRQPTAVAFSPDGQRLAVGYEDVPRVDLLDTATLTLRHQPDVSGPGHGNLSSVAFSADGQWLAASGRGTAAGSKAWIRRWGASGTGPGQSVPTPVSEVMELVALPGAAGPAWIGVAEDPAVFKMGRDGRIEMLGMPSAATHGATELQLGAGGWSVQWTPAGGEGKRESLVFDLRQRRFQPGRLSDAESARTGSAPRSQWQGLTRPVILGREVKALQEHETARSLALLPSGDLYALGTDYFLRWMRADGQPAWETGQAAPGAVWAVNTPFSGPLAGQVLVAAYGDGTVRWHRTRDGRELLALYAHRDGKTWVLWTPGGHYDASPGGEALIGWHVDRGPDQAADYFPADRFQASLYRPDVIDLVLETLDDSVALQRANEALDARRRPAANNIAQALPPVVELLSAAEVRTSEPTVRVRVRARSAADAPVTQWAVRVDGAIQPQLRGLAHPDAGAGVAKGEREFVVTVPSRNSEISLTATNRHGSSSAQVVRVIWAGSSATPEVRKPVLYLLAIGVGQFQSPAVNSLEDLPAKDARDFASTLGQQKGKLYERVESRVLTDRQATRENLAAALEWLRTAPGENDVSVLFLSGHGVVRPPSDYHFVPWNADPSKLWDTTLDWRSIRAAMQSNAGRRLVFIDTCHAGYAFTGGTPLAPHDINPALNGLMADQNGVVVFASSTGRQVSQQRREWQNGAFTKALVESLSGAASPRWRTSAGYVTHKFLDIYLSERVKELTRGAQTPTTPDPLGVPDFEIARIAP